MPPPEKTLLSNLPNKPIFFFDKIKNLNGNIKYHSQKSAFTLAETLITIGIIGIVASMTLPSLIQNHREKETAAKLKKTY